jgi:hypothetical protein
MWTCWPRTAAGGAPLIVTDYSTVCTRNVVFIFYLAPPASQLSTRDERREVLQPWRQCSFPVSVPQNPNVYLAELILIDEIKPIV